MQDQSGELRASGTVGSTSTAEAKVIANFAWQHMKAATLFRDQVVHLEAANRDQPFGMFFEEIRSYCSACLMSATAALEALINEIFIDPHRPLRRLFRDFENEFWGRRGIEQLPILKKYNKALTMMNCSLLDTGSPSYQDVKALIEFRDMLVHYKPTWDEPRPSSAELERILKNRIAVSPFPDGTADFFAVGGMSASCASWAVSSAFRFIDAFASIASPDLAPDKFAGFRKLCAESAVGDALNATNRD